MSHSSGGVLTKGLVAVWWETGHIFLKLYERFSAYVEEFFPRTLNEYMTVGGMRSLDANQRHTIGPES